MVVSFVFFAAINIEFVKSIITIDSYNALTIEQPNAVLPTSIMDAVRDALRDKKVKFDQIGNAALAEDVADQTSKFLVISSFGRKYVLIISNSRFPATVGAAVKRLQDARSVLISKTQDVAELPVSHGSADGVSYALWSYRPPLSNHRVYLYLQKRLLVPKVCDWLERMAVETMTGNLAADVVKRDYIDPLEKLGLHMESHPWIRKAIQDCILRIEKSKGRLVHVLEHGDFWRGNVLIKGPYELLSPLENGFIVIDWGGARVAGYPFFDLLRFLMSFNLSGTKTAGYISSMTRAIGCDSDDVVIYVLSALAKLHEEIDNFPEQSFIGLCEASLHKLAEAGVCNTD